MRWLLLAVPLAVTPPDLAAKSLARCCGTERATLGPLFGKLAIGPLRLEEAKMVYVDGVPKYLQRDKIGLKIDLYPGEGQFHSYLDGVAIEVPEHDRCVALQARLEKAWGPQDKWINSARHQRASLTWGTPDSDEPACTLVIARIPSADPAHCLKDERPSMVREIDVANHCLAPARARGCELDRERALPRLHGWCVADDKTHTFSSADDPTGRQCTAEEETQLDFYKLRACH